LRKLKNKQKIEDEHLQIMAEKITANVDRATKIINHLREFGRKTDMTFEKVQVNHLLAKAHELLSQQLKVRGIEVVWQLGEELPEIKADPVRLEQVFLNLLLNARDAIEEKLSTALTKRGLEKITLRTSSEGDKVTVEVADTGSGIPKDKLDKIFEPFFTTKSVGKGTGLGLSISYGIIKDCGGNIRVKSDKGARFIIEFPIPLDEQS
jgi:histidine kinase